MGRGWYHKALDVPEAWRGKKVLVEFEGVYMNSHVWLDEHFIGLHPYGYTSFIYDLTPYLKYGKQNLLRVMVDNGQPGEQPLVFRLRHLPPRPAVDL